MIVLRLFWYLSIQVHYFVWNKFIDFVLHHWMKDIIFFSLLQMPEYWVGSVTVCASMIFHHIQDFKQYFIQRFLKTIVSQYKKLKTWITAFNINPLMTEHILFSSRLSNLSFLFEDCMKNMYYIFKMIF